MTDHDAFETRLAEALRSYAAEAPPDPEALAFARAVIGGAGGSSRASRRSGWRTAIIVLAAAALLLASMIALALAGSGRRAVFPLTLLDPEPTPTLAPAPSIPTELTGQFQAQLAATAPDGGVDYPWFLLDLADPALVRGPSHAEWDALRADPGGIPGWSGRVVEFAADGERSAEIGLDGTASCGPARYRATWDDSTLRLSPLDDACAERVSVLAAREWTHMVTRLSPGGRYGSGSFGEPFRFQVPAALAPDPFGSMYAWTWLGPGRLRLGMIWWHGLFVDDEPLYVDACDPTKGTLTDVPSTPEAVGEWLREWRRSNRSLMVGEPGQIEVDGRTALRFDVGVDCANGRVASFGPTVPTGRLYAIPTGDDTVLYVTVSDGGVVDFDSASDELVRSMTFE